MNKLAKMAIALLDDRQGINDCGFAFLCEVLYENGLDDIADSARQSADELRWYLNANDVSRLEQKYQ